MMLLVSLLLIGLAVWAFIAAVAPERGQRADDDRGVRRRHEFGLLVLTGFYMINPNEGRRDPAVRRPTKGTDRNRKGCAGCLPWLTRKKICGAGQQRHFRQDQGQ